MKLMPLVQGGALAALLVLGLAPSRVQAQTAPATTVQVVHHDYSVTPSQASAPRGTITFAVTNQGQMPHELVILRTDHPSNGLVMDPDGSKAAEDVPGQKDVGEVEDIAPGATKSGTFDLPPGHYVLLCNLPGHYKLGMATDFTVTPVTLAAASLPDTGQAPLRYLPLVGLAALSALGLGLVLRRSRVIGRAADHSSDH